MWKIIGGIVTAVTFFILIVQFTTGKQDFPGLISKDEQKYLESGDSRYFSGAWDTLKSTEIIGLQLSKYSGEWPFHDQNKLAHRIYQTYNYSEKSIERFVVAISTIPSEEAYDCHACLPVISLFEFENYLNGWRMVSSGINLAAIGSWGGNEPDVELKKLSDDKYAVFFRNGYGNMGENYNYISAYRPISGIFKNIFQMESSASNSNDTTNDCCWSSKINFKNCNEPYFDIVVEITGSISKHLEGTELENIAGNKYVYRFDGAKYKTIDIKYDVYDCY